MGKEKKKNEFIFEGQFHKGYKEGLGRLITKNHIIKGNFKKGQVNGICEIFFINSKNSFRGINKNHYS